MQQTLKEYEVAKEDEFKTNTKSVDVRPILRSVTTQFPERQTHFKARAVQVDRILTADKSTSTDDLEIFCEISEYTDQLVADTVNELMRDIVSEVILDCTSESETSFHEQDHSFILDSDQEFLDHDVELPSPSSSFVVFWSQLLILLQNCVCVYCGSLTKINGYFYNGSMIGVHMLCGIGHKFIWHSQTMIKGIAVGNLRLSAAILFSGNTYTRFKDIFRFSSIKHFEKSTYQRYQNKYLFGVINETWLDERARVLQHASKKGYINVIGDGRCDSPGHNAKYLTYSMQDQESKEVASLNVVQVTEAGNSNNMELLGFKRALADIEINATVKQVTTDRHSQVRKYMLDEEKDKVYQNDVWHVVKGLLKKLRKAAKKKDCALLNKWMRSICNHLWWSSATCGGSYEILKEKWISILQHVKNRHSWGGCKFVHKYCHPKLTPTEERRKKWMKAGTPPYHALQQIALEKRLLKDLRYLTNFDHTGSTEVYNALLNKYCPKSTHFSYEGMVARSQLAALDHNAGASLPQSTTKMGVARWNVAFPKHSKNWVVKPIKATKSKAYVYRMVDRVISAAAREEAIQRINIPVLPPNIAFTPKPSKLDIIDAHRSRFSNLDH